MMDKIEIRKFRAALREMVRELGMLSRKSSGTQLSPLQSHILIELDVKPCGVIELAAKLCVDKASISRTIRHLIEANYLLKERDKLDGRASTFRLSDIGKQMLDTIEQNADKFTLDALSSSSDYEVAFFLKSIKQLSTGLRNARHQRDANLIIRPITEQDNAAMAKLIRNSFCENKIDHLDGVSLHDPELDQLSQTYQKLGASYWVAELDGKIVGGAGFAPLYGVNDTCELQKLFFSRHVKGMGLGRRMLAHILSQAKSMKYTFCYLETLNELKDAVKLYEAFDFQYTTKLGNTGHNSCDIYMLNRL